MRTRGTRSRPRHGRSTRIRQGLHLISRPAAADKRAVSGRAHPDLPTEQAYIDYAYECLDRMRERVERATDAASTEFAADALEAWSARTLESYADAERGICF